MRGEFEGMVAIQVVAFPQDGIVREPGAAKAMGLVKFKLEVGAPANIIVLDIPNVLEALRYHRAPTHIISHGKVLDNLGVE